MIKILKLLFLE